MIYESWKEPEKVEIARIESHIRELENSRESTAICIYRYLFILSFRIIFFILFWFERKEREREKYIYECVSCTSKNCKVHIIDFARYLKISEGIAMVSE